MKKVISVVLALVLISALSVSAFAAGSVTAPVVEDKNGGTITITPDAEGKEFTFEADPKDGYDFVGWEIDGNYEIVKGSLDSEKITVKFKDSGLTVDDISYKAIFKKVSDEGPDKDPDESPATGDSAALAVLAVVSLGGMVISKRKLSK